MVHSGFLISRALELRGLRGCACPIGIERLPPTPYPAPDGPPLIPLATVRAGAREGSQGRLTLDIVYKGV